MLGRIIEITESPRYLSKYRGFMVIHHGSEELAKVPLDDISAVIVTGYGVTHSSRLLAALAKRGVPFVLCGTNHSPVGMLWSVEGNYHQAKRIHAQLKASKPLNKRLWQQVVRSKLAMQAAVLKSLAKPDLPVKSLIRQVKSGDPDNIESQAARRYWQSLFGKTFRRNRDAEDLNALLNYGYMVLRAATARSLIAAGLHPSIGIHHCNAYNAMQLVDDLIEPFRPFVDNKIYHLNEALAEISVNKETKQALAKLMYQDMPSEYGVTPLMSHLHRLATSLAQIYLDEKATLELPLIPTSLEMQAMGRHVKEES